MKNVEIEKKFLLENLPINIDRFKSNNITQGYVSINPEIRIRSINNETFYLTKKGNGTLFRKEKEKEIDIEKFNKLVNKYEPKMIYKTRYYIPLTAKLTAEVDVFKDNLEGLKTVEVEFETIEEANNFIIPNWFGKEVTNDPNYKNKNLINITNKTKRK